MMNDMHDAATRIFAVRHGETAWNRLSKIQGHIDIPLNDVGRWQAKQVGVALAEESVDVVYSSDLTRAHETAQAIGLACGLPVLTEPQLRERHFGILEGLTQEEISLRWPVEAQRGRARDPAYGPAGGETLQVFYERCVAALKLIAHRHLGQAIVLVAHGGVLDCFYRAAMGVPVSYPRSWPIDNAAIHRLLYTPDGISMVCWGDGHHLGHGNGLDEVSDGARFHTPSRA